MRGVSTRHSVVTVKLGGVARGAAAGGHSWGKSIGEGQDLRGGRDGTLALTPFGFETKFEGVDDYCRKTLTGQRSDFSGKGGGSGVLDVQALQNSTFRWQNSKSYRARNGCSAFARDGAAPID